MQPVRVTSAAVALLVTAASACANQVQTPKGEGAAGALANVGLGAAVAPLHRAATGCYTPCAYGTVCDENNGVCVTLESPEGPPAPFATAGSPPPALAPVCSPGCLGGQICGLVQGVPVCQDASRAPAP